MKNNEKYDVDALYPQLNQPTSKNEMGISQKELNDLYEKNKGEYIELQNKLKISNEASRSLFLAGLQSDLLQSTFPMAIKQNFELLKPEKKGPFHIEDVLQPGDRMVNVFMYYAHSNIELKIIIDYINAFGTMPNDQPYIYDATIFGDPNWYVFIDNSQDKAVLELDSVVNDLKIRKMEHTNEINRLNATIEHLSNL